MVRVVRAAQWRVRCRGVCAWAGGAQACSQEGGCKRGGVVVRVAWAWAGEQAVWVMRSGEAAAMHHHARCSSRAQHRPWMHIAVRSSHTTHPYVSLGVDQLPAEQVPHLQAGQAGTYRVSAGVECACMHARYAHTLRLATAEPWPLSLSASPAVTCVPACTTAGPGPP